MNNEDDLVPMFPLSSVVLFPRVVTPLHIFEPRYRQMTAEALEGEGEIAMVTVVPESSEGEDGDPPVYSIGCVGKITQAEELPDGRYHIVIVGTERVRIVSEAERPEDRLYRVAEVERLEDSFPAEEEGRVAELRGRIISLVAELVKNEDSDEESTTEVNAETFEALDDAAFVNSLANGFPFPAEEKQSLLEANSVPERFERLAALLGFLHAERLGAGSVGSGQLN